MISNSYDLVLGLYIAIVLFFAGYIFLGDTRDYYMKNNALNWILITFFIIMFFLFGYLFQNVFMTIIDTRNKNGALQGIDVPKVINDQ